MNEENGMAQARYAGMRWNTPLSQEHARHLLGLLDLAGASTVLDLGCGWGELLLRAVEAAAETCTGIGVDTDDALLERARRSSAARGLDQRVTFIAAPAADWAEPADRVFTIGATHAWGGTPETLTALDEVVSPGGRLLFGDGCWERQPTEAALAIFGDEVLHLRDIVRHSQDAGWRVLSASTADQREWDEFESSWRRGQEEWLLANPDAPSAAGAREQLDERLAEYLTAYRGVLGFCYLVLAH